MKKGKLFSLFMLGAIALGALSGCNKPVYTKDAELASNVVQAVNEQYNMNLDTSTAVLRDIYIPTIEDGTGAVLTIVAEDDNKPYFILADTYYNGLSEGSIHHKEDGYKYVIDTLLENASSVEYTFKVLETTYETLAQITDMAGSKTTLINSDVEGNSFQWGYINSIIYYRVNDNTPYQLVIDSNIKTLDENNEEVFYNRETFIDTNCSDLNALQGIILQTLEDIENNKELENFTRNADSENLLYSSEVSSETLTPPVEEEPQQ